MYIKTTTNPIIRVNKLSSKYKKKTRWSKVKTLSQALDIITSAEPPCNFIEPLKL